jgi:hypothetical protein
MVTAYLYYHEHPRIGQAPFQHSMCCLIESWQSWRTSRTSSLRTEHASMSTLASIASVMSDWVHNALSDGSGNVGDRG